jgi:hypothetical protein
LATCKTLRRELRLLVKQEREAWKAVREANAKVVELTTKLPPVHVETASAAVARESVKPFVEAAQNASNKFWTLADEVINKRGAVALCARKKS